MKKNYEIEKGLEIGDKVFMVNEIKAGKRMIPRFITGHIVINNKDGEQEVLVFLGSITEATFRPVRRDEIMLPSEAKNFLEDKHNDMLKKVFGD